MTIPFIQASSNNFQTGRKDLNTTGNPERIITKIIIHTMEGTFNGTVSWFQNPKSKSSAHYLVGLKGQVSQMVKESDTAYHATNYPYNLSSIGIECEDGGKPVSVRTDALYESVAQLVADIAKRYGIVINRSNVLKHNEVFKGKSCPGNLDVERIVRRAQELLTATSVSPSKPKSQFDFYPSSRSITIIAEKGANIRSTPTTTEKNILKTVPMNTTIAVDGFVVGDPYGSNKLWWKVKDQSIYVWSGATNVIPTIPSSVPSIAPVSDETTGELSKESLQAKIKQLTDDINQLMKDNSDKDKSFQSLQKDFDRVQTILSSTEDQRLSYDTMKAANESLVAQIDQYKTKVLELQKAQQDTLLRAFDGWQFFEMPAGASAISELPIAAMKLKELLQNRGDKNVVVGFKIGGKLVAINKKEEDPSADLSILNS